MKGLIFLIGLVALAMLIYYLYILMEGDKQ